MCTSLEFNEFFGSSFDVPCFVFSSFVVQFSRYRFVAALCDSLYSISHSVPFVKGFSKLFSGFFSTFSFASSRIFLLLFCALPVSPCLSGTGSLAELYYITTFFSFCQPLFSLFSPFFTFFGLSFRRFGCFILFLVALGAWIGFLTVFEAFWEMGIFNGKFLLLYADSRFAEPRFFQKDLIGLYRFVVLVRWFKVGRTSKLPWKVLIVAVRSWGCGALIRGLRNLGASLKGFNCCGAKLQLRCADLRFAEPRSFPERELVYSFRVYEKNQKYTRGLRTSGLRGRFKALPEVTLQKFPAARAETGFACKTPA